MVRTREFGASQSYTTVAIWSSRADGPSPSTGRPTLYCAATLQVESYPDIERSACFISSHCKHPAHEATGAIVGLPLTHFTLVLTIGTMEDSFFVLYYGLSICNCGSIDTMIISIIAHKLQRQQGVDFDTKCHLFGSYAPRIVRLVVLDHRWTPSLR